MRAAYQSCERIARAHYENFPVASVLIPAAMRPHVAALYAFARIADDFADEGALTPADRLRLLDGWLCRLRLAADGQTGARPADVGEPAEAEEIFLALGHSIRQMTLPLSLFEDLLSAFRQDVTVNRYESWADLLDYCRRSANPVGRLVLRIAGYDDARLDAWSDATCTALQLTNFWQDIDVDFGRGRIYLPAEEMRAHGADPSDLTKPRMTPAWRHVLDAAVGRTRALFAAGRPVCDGVRGRLKFELRATWLGGMRILDRIEKGGTGPGGDDRMRPTLGKTDAPWLAWHLLTWARQ